MPEPAVVLAGAAVGVAVGAAGGLLVPAAIARLPEPPPDRGGDHGETPSVVAEPAKERYADLARRPWLRPAAVGAGALAGGLVGLGAGSPTSSSSLSVVWLLALVPVGTLLGVVDWRTRLLPSVVVLPATGLVVSAGVVLWLATGREAATTEDLLRALAGLAVARSVFWVLWFVRRAGMGFGDVRLAALLGFVLGWEGWAVLVVGLYAAFVLFGVPGLLLALVRRDRGVLSRAYPFGPFMLLGAVLGVALGPVLPGGLVAG